MGALGRLKEAADTSAEECDCGRVCSGPLMTIADARELIATVETQEAELAALKAHTTDVTEELHRQLDTARREAAALHDASEVRYARLRIANAHLSRLADIVRTNCEEGKLHGFAAPELGWRSGLHWSTPLTRR